jgi:molecular chaperone GrpE
MSESKKNSAENSENPENLNAQNDANENINPSANEITNKEETPIAVDEEANTIPLENEDGINKMLDQINELKDKYLRLQAEFDNYKKRNAKERMDLMMTANKETVVSMLEVLDDADRAETQMKDSDDVAAIKEGINLVFGKLRKTLENKGVKALESKGMDFDVELHEAITEVPMPGQEGKVIDEVVKGYYLNDKLIRFAKVVIGK